MSARFLILQLRPEDEAADEEFGAFPYPGRVGAGSGAPTGSGWISRALPAARRLTIMPALSSVAGPAVSAMIRLRPKTPLEARIEADMLFSIMPESPGP